MKTKTGNLNFTFFSAHPHYFTNHHYLLQMFTNNNNNNNQHPRRQLSVSNYHHFNNRRPQQQQQQFIPSLSPAAAPNSVFEVSQYINPNSQRAQRAIQAHYRREQYADWRSHDSYKTVMCQNWLSKAQCSFGKNCRFAHGFDEMRTPRGPPPINDKYKTRPCDKYVNQGLCPYGYRCLFIHPETDEDSLPPPPVSLFTHSAFVPTPAADKPSTSATVAASISQSSFNEVDMPPVHNLPQPFQFQQGGPSNQNARWRCHHQQQQWSNQQPQNDSYDREHEQELERIVQQLIASPLFPQ